MVEKFSDYESAGYLSEEGEFEFTIKDYELKDSKAGNRMAVFNVESEHGMSTLYHVLEKNSKWSYNNLIKACLHLDTKEKIDAFECDYETIGQELIGKKFIGVVECETYEKQVKKPLDDGTFEDAVEVKESYKIKSYKMC